jgi:hypothetical protein
MISRTIALAVAVFSLLPATAQALPGVLTQTGRGSPFVVRPAQIVYTGDGSGVLGGFSGTGPYPRYGRLKWSGWNSRQAVGSGAVWLDDCEPDCAEGTFHSYAVKVHAFDPQADHFTRLTLRYDYEGKEVIDRRGVSKFSSNYAYYIIGISPS